MKDVLRFDFGKDKAFDGVIDRQSLESGWHGLIAGGLSVLTVIAWFGWLYHEEKRRFRVVKGIRRDSVVMARPRPLRLSRPDFALVEAPRNAG